MRLKLKCKYYKTAVGHCGPSIAAAGPAKRIKTRKAHNVYQRARLNSKQIRELAAQRVRGEVN